MFEFAVSPHWVLEGIYAIDFFQLYVLCSKMFLTFVRSKKKQTKWEMEIVFLHKQKTKTSSIPQPPSGVQLQVSNDVNEKCTILVRDVLAVHFLGAWAGGKDGAGLMVVRHAINVGGFQ